MNRRSFIRVVGMTTLGVASAGCAGRSPSDARALARPELLVALGAAPVRAIGARYRALTPAERDVDALRDAIVGSRLLRARLVGAASPPIAEMVRDDFQHGRTVLIDGWLLSVTEARQCALYSLLAA
jgi:hypothetical protein